MLGPKELCDALYDVRELSKALKPPVFDPEGTQSEWREAPIVGPEGTRILSQRLCELVRALHREEGDPHLKRLQVVYTLTYARLGLGSPRIPIDWSCTRSIADDEGEEVPHKDSIRNLLLKYIIAHQDLPLLTLAIDNNMFGVFYYEDENGDERALDPLQGSDGSALLDILTNMVGPSATVTSPEEDEWVCREKDELTCRMFILAHSALYLGEQEGEIGRPLWNRDEHDEGENEGENEGGDEDENEGDEDVMQEMLQARQQAQQEMWQAQQEMLQAQEAAYQQPLQCETKGDGTVHFECLVKHGRIDIVRKYAKYKIERGYGKYKREYPCVYDPAYFGEGGSDEPCVFAKLIAKGNNEMIRAIAPAVRYLKERYSKDDYHTLLPNPEGTDVECNFIVYALYHDQLDTIAVLFELGVPFEDLAEDERAVLGREKAATYDQQLEEHLVAHGIKDDYDPAYHDVDQPSLFARMIAEGKNDVIRAIAPAVEYLQDVNAKTEYHTILTYHTFFVGLEDVDTECNFIVYALYHDQLDTIKLLVELGVPFDRLTEGERAVLGEEKAATYYQLLHEYDLLANGVAYDPARFEGRQAPVFAKMIAQGKNDVIRAIAPAVLYLTDEHAKEEYHTILGCPEGMDVECNFIVYALYHDQVDTIAVLLELGVPFSNLTEGERAVLGEEKTAHYRDLQREHYRRTRIPYEVQPQCSVVFAKTPFDAAHDEAMGVEAGT